MAKVIRWWAARRARRTAHVDAVLIDTLTAVADRHFGAGNAHADARATVAAIVAYERSGGGTWSR